MRWGIICNVRWECLANNWPEAFGESTNMVGVGGRIHVKRCGCCRKRKVKVRGSFQFLLRSMLKFSIQTNSVMERHPLVKDASIMACSVWVMRKNLNSSTSMAKTKSMLRDPRARRNFLLLERGSNSQLSQVGVEQLPVTRELMSPDPLITFL
jgi:hypothetical protein